MKHRLLAATAAISFFTLATGAQAQLGAAYDVTLTPVGTHHTGLFDEGAAEIVAFDSKTDRVFAVNAAASAVDVINIANPNNPVHLTTINAAALGGSANSVDVRNGIVAVAIEADDKQAPGLVAFYDSMTLALLKTVQVGALPDMVTFTPDGRYVLVANEGEPNGDYDVDPVGSISIINISGGVAGATVATAGFTQFNGQENALRAQGIRIFGPGANAAKDLEPEYVTVSPDSRTAWATIQEANAIAKIDIRTATITALWPLGTKDHSLAENALDPSNSDGGIHIGTWPVKGFYLPDGAASYRVRGRDYIVTANEGDVREYEGDAFEFIENARVRDLDLDAAAFPTAATLRANANLGRLNVTTAQGDIDGDGFFEELYSFGGRSFSIWDGANGSLVFDSGSEIEEITADLLPDDFNSTNSENDSFDSRSDDKGPEPEGVTLGTINGIVFAFIGLERIGGIMVYDISNPAAPRFVTYVNNRNFAVDAQLGDGSTNPAVGDLGPEGLEFIPASDSPNGKNLLVVGNEISGTTTIYEIGFEFRRAIGGRRR